MKRILLLTMLLIYVSGFSQKRSKRDTEVTMFVGYSNFWYSEKSKKTSGAIEACDFGILGDYFLSSSWSFHTGFQYVTMGGKNLPYSSEFPADGQEKIGFINMPLNANWHFGKRGNWNINFGITPAALVNSRGTYPGFGISSVQLQDVKYRFQLGANAGIGYQIPIYEHFNLLLEYQVFAGLTDFSKNTSTTVLNNGYNFNVGGVFKM